MEGFAHNMSCHVSGHSFRICFCRPRWLLVHSSWCWKTPCSTSLTCWSYALFFSCSFFLYYWLRKVFWWLHEGAEHPYVKNAWFWSLPQKLSAAMSGHAPSSLFADPSVRCLPVGGWSGGSILTLDTFQWETQLWCPWAQCGKSKGIHHIVSKGHLEMHLCGGQIRFRQ